LSLPADAEYVRTTPTFTEASVPAGLLAEHLVAAGNWAVLLVETGALSFVFDDGSEAVSLLAGDRQVIPPGRYHHLVIDEPVSFSIEFYRATS